MWAAALDFKAAGKKFLNRHWQTEYGLGIAQK